MSVVHASHVCHRYVGWYGSGAIWQCNPIYTRETTVLRRRIDLIQEASSIALIEDTREAPRLVLEWLNVHDFNKQDVTRFCPFNFKRATEIMDLGQVYVLDIVGRVVVPNLAASPVDCQFF